MGFFIRQGSGLIVMLYVGEEKTMIEVATGTVSAMVLLAKEGRYL